MLGASPTHKLFRAIQLASVFLVRNVDKNDHTFNNFSMFGGRVEGIV